VRCDQLDRGRTLRQINDTESAALRLQLLESGAVDHAREVARRYIEEARGELRQLAETPARQLMESLADSMISRQR
jgi:geranylgeranyl pyrophosphate synthase